MTLAADRAQRKRTRVGAAVVLLMGLALVGCESSGMAERQTSELNKSYATCLKNEARRVDNGAAEPATVAMAIWPTCSRFFARSARLLPMARTQGLAKNLTRGFDWATSISQRKWWLSKEQKRRPPSAESILNGTGVARLVSRSRAYPHG